MTGFEINIQNNAVAYFDSLGRYTKLAMIEQSSKAGDLARKSIRSEFRKATTEWSKHYDKNGNLVIDKKTSKLGQRLSHQNQRTANPKSMESFIQSMTHMTTGTTVVMGAFKGHKPVKIEKGKIVGYEKYLSTVTRSSIAILEKLNSGEKSSTYMKAFPKGSVKGQFRGKQKYKDRRWAEKGFSKAYAGIKDEMTNKLARLIANHEYTKGRTA